MAKKIFKAGNTGGRIRSDCLMNLELTGSGGIKINLESKVKKLYGEDIINTSKEVCSFFDIKNASIDITDTGALPFVLTARLEACIKQAIKTDKEYLLPLIEENTYSTPKEQFRFSRLYLPGNTPSMMLNAGVHKPNGIILDLEDSVAPAKKAEAQLLVRNALRQVNFYGAERMVRINQFPGGLDDLKYIIPHNVNLILFPKCESAEQIHKLEEKINELKTKFNIKQPVFLMPIIESALGVEMAYEIASSSENVVALAIGLEDYTADLGARRTKEATESFYARTRLVNACKAAGIQAIDSVFSDVADEEGLRQNVKISKSLGFEGMGCIHPRQIKVIHEGYAPEEAEIEKAKKIVNAFIEASEKGLGVVSLGTKMIDPPVVKRAQKIIDLAVKLNMLPENWRKDFLNNKAI
ncbi:MAG: HpcH/HpaI aldolase/citrate lyase family protein [Chlorobi bacterium]|nr:HpcH/HpaI aldolase/citrate lyase family protein [Chlorobiota bacterium]